MSKTEIPSTSTDDWRNSYSWYTHETQFIRFIKAGYRLVYSPLMKVNLEGTENLPVSGPCVLASNHVSNFDPQLILVYLRVRHVFYMAKIELFETRFNRYFFAKAGAFPVKRGEVDSWALEHAGQVLQAGQILGMFPEGTRSKNKGRLRKGKLGTVSLALTYQVPIVPAAIINSQNVRVGAFQTAVTIKIGEPLDIVTLAGPPPHEPRKIKALTTVLMQKIAAMLPSEQRGIYG
jgi:1-acyl-sn-glycerol-3-phosphate acyltransferase